MNGVAGSLAGKVSEKKIDIGLADGSVFVEALKKISRTENSQNIRLHGDIGARPRSQVEWQGSKRLTTGQGLLMSARLKKKPGSREQSHYDRKSPMRFHGRASFLELACARPIKSR